MTKNIKYRKPIPIAGIQVEDKTIKRMQYGGVAIPAGLSLEELLSALGGATTVAVPVGAAAAALPIGMILAGAYPYRPKEVRQNHSNPEVQTQDNTVVYRQPIPTSRALSPEEFNAVLAQQLTGHRTLSDAELQAILARSLVDRADTAAPAAPTDTTTVTPTAATGTTTAAPAAPNVDPENNNNRRSESENNNRRSESEGNSDSNDSNHSRREYDSNWDEFTDIKNWNWTGFGRKAWKSIPWLIGGAAAYYGGFSKLAKNAVDNNVEVWNDGQSTQKQSTQSKQKSKETQQSSQEQTNYPTKKDGNTTNLDSIADILLKMKGSHSYN